MQHYGGVTSPWGFAGESPSLTATGGLVTLVEGGSFCLSGRSGDIAPGSPQGLFVLDTRVLSALEVTVDGRPLEPLGVAMLTPFAAVITTRPRPTPGGQHGRMVVLRRRYIGDGLREDIEVRNNSDEPVPARLRVRWASDFASIFEVKEGRLRRRAHPEVAIEAEQVRLSDDSRQVPRTAVITTCGAVADELSGEEAYWEIEVPARGTWSVCLQASLVIGGKPVEPRYRCGQPVDHAMPSQRFKAWRGHVPVIDTDHAPLEATVARSLEDLGSLRIADPQHPNVSVVAAGAPWFMSLFGRDSLLTSWMALVADPSLAEGVLDTLARLQGSKVDHATEEEPGRIAHEVRPGGASEAFGDGTIYYGSADATPLFVMLLGELRRWGLADDAVDRLLPHADRAIDWLTTYGDRDGDGFVEYERATSVGLYNQGWKDSADAITFADGSLAEPPIAVCEVQGYAYAAFLARAYFAEEHGDDERARSLRERAARLKEAFNRDFWLPNRGHFALALDRDKRPVDALASNMGHCLWSGIVDEDKAAAVAAHLLSPEMFSGWGVRTLATSMAAYDPLSYHNGSVWPHDNALVAAGLVRYGFVAEAHRIILGMLDAAAATAWRMPELLSGLARDDIPEPVGYPTSCSPQAWSAASPLLFLRTLLRLDPWIPHGLLWLSPKLPTEIGRLTVSNIPLAGARAAVTVDSDGSRITGLPDHIRVVQRPRAPLTATG